MKAAICIDAWKLPIFERHLTQSGFTFETHPGITDDSLTLKVDTDSGGDLVNACTQANLEASRKGSPHEN